MNLMMLTEVIETTETTYLSGGEATLFFLVLLGIPFIIGLIIGLIVGDKSSRSRLKLAENTMSRAQELAGQLAEREKELAVERQMDALKNKAIAEMSELESKKFQNFYESEKEKNLVLTNRVKQLEDRLIEGAFANIVKN